MKLDDVDLRCPYCGSHDIAIRNPVVHSTTKARPTRPRLVRPHHLFLCRSCKRVLRRVLARRDGAA